MSQQYISFKQGGDRQRKVSSAVTMSESDRPTCSLLKPPTPILVCFGVILGVMSVAQIVMGAKYQFDCPRQHYISIYLLANGVVSLLLIAIIIPPCGAACFGDHSKGWACLWSLFLFCWFIAGNAWIYSIYDPKTATSTGSCNKALYQFAFWTMNLYYIMLGLYICSICLKWLFCRDRYKPVNV